MSEIRLGYYFARLSGSDRLTVVRCWDNVVDKQVKEDVEIIEPVPRKVLEGKYKVLNLRSLQHESR